MLYHEPRLAPAPMLVRYLAVFHRFFTAVIDYTRDGDKPGMLLGGFLADALHNVPAMLWHCDPNAWHNPTKMDVWIQKFPEIIREKAAPERFITASRTILSAKGGAQELGLRDDLADLDLAPLPKMREYLNKLYRACLSMRFMRNYGSRPPVVWEGLEQAWSAEAERADAQANFNGVIASMLLPVPDALVQWRRFDEEQFHSAALSAAELLPAEQREVWIAYFSLAVKPPHG